MNRCPLGGVSGKARALGEIVSRKRLQGLELWRERRLCRQGLSQTDTPVQVVEQLRDEH